MGAKTGWTSLTAFSVPILALSFVLLETPRAILQSYSVSVWLMCRMSLIAIHCLKHSTP